MSLRTFLMDWLGTDEQEDLIEELNSGQFEEANYNSLSFKSLGGRRVEITDDLQEYKPITVDEDTLKTKLRRN